MIETSSVHPRKSSEIFGNLRKISENVRKRSPYLRNNFGESSEIFGKWSEIFGKPSKTSSLVCLCNKQNITCSLVDMNFIFECSTRYLTSERSERVRCRVEHDPRARTIHARSCNILYFFIFLFYFTDFALYFPNKGVTNYANIWGMRSLSRFTACFWMKSSASSPGSPFSYSIKTSDNELRIYNYYRDFHLWIGGKSR